MSLKEILYPPFVKQWLKGGSVWLYSDPHFSDPEMYFIRKNYVDDEEQIKRINSKVGKKDTIIVLGDIGDTEFVKKIRGYKVLIMGNHDKGASNYKRNIITPNVMEKDNFLFDEVYEGCLTISDKIILSHEPIENLQPYFFNIHGHDHSNRFVGPRHLNVCAEHINYTPVNLSSIIKEGLLKDVESLHRITIDQATERKQHGKKRCD